MIRMMIMMMTMNMTTTEIMRILAETGSYVELFSVKFVEMIGQLFINPCSSKCIGWLVKALSEVMHKDGYSVYECFFFFRNHENASCEVMVQYDFISYFCGLESPFCPKIDRMFIFSNTNTSCVCSFKRTVLVSTSCKRMNK